MVFVGLWSFLVVWRSKVAFVGWVVGLSLVYFPWAGIEGIARQTGVIRCQGLITLGLIRLFVPSFIATNFATAACRVFTTSCAKFVYEN